MWWIYAILLTLFYGMIDTRQYLLKSRPGKGKTNCVLTCLTVDTYICRPLRKALLDSNQEAREDHCGDLRTEHPGCRPW